MANETKAETRPNETPEVDRAEEAIKAAKASEKVIEVLKGFAPSQQLRILRAAAVMLGIELPQKQGQQQRTQGSNQQRNGGR